MAVPHHNTELLAIHSQPGGCRRIPYIGSERQNFVRKAGACYKPCEEKSGNRRTEAPLKFHTLYRGWANENEPLRTQLLLLQYFIKS